MKNWISFPRYEGMTSRQAHADFPHGTYEREFSKDGFFGPSTQMHHKNPPTNWIEWDGDLRPRAYDLNLINQPTTSPWDSKIVLHNAHTQMRYWSLGQSMTDLVRNADGDQLLFFHAGSGELFCDYGHLTINEGDYLMLPRGTMWRLEVTTPMDILMIEATNDSYKLPDKGLVGAQAIFDPAILDVPALNERYKVQQQDNRNWKIIIKRHNKISTVTYPYNPLDVVGWHGTLMPVRINWRDIRPMLSDRYHLPPSAHTTFMSNRFVVCTFCPRPLESDPGALKVPFYHNNDDYDEVLFYHRGNFFSRDNIKPGMITFHPAGFTHGPHPDAYDKAMQGGKKDTDEVAVMLDTRDALEVGDIDPTEVINYVDSWRKK